MAQLVCFRCRKRVPNGFRVCPVCGVGATEVGEVEWTEMEVERHFMLARGREFTDPRSPRFMGIPEWWLERLALETPFVDSSDLEPTELGWDADELVEAVRVHDGALRAEAAVRIGALGVETPETIMAVALALKEPEGKYRKCVYWAISQIGNPALLRPLMMLLGRERDSECWTWLRVALMCVCNRQLDRGTRPERAVGTEHGLALDVRHRFYGSGATPDYLAKRAGLARMQGAMLAAVGFATRAWESSNGTCAEALLERSQVFLLMGKPILALDDFLLSPRHSDRREEAFERHRFGLLEVCRTLEATCVSQGMHGMASLFAARLRLLETG